LRGLEVIPQLMRSETKKGEDKMTIETLRKKATWDLKAMIKALSQPISSFLNTDEDNERLENCKLVLKERIKQNEKI